MINIKNEKKIFIILYNECFTNMVYISYRFLKWKF